MCKKAIEQASWVLENVPDHFKREEMYNDAMCIEPYTLYNAPDHFKMQEMCNKAVHIEPCSLVFVPDHFKT